MGRHGAARLFEPNDRLVDARLEKMDSSNPEIQVADLRITRTEAESATAGLPLLSIRSPPCTGRWVSVYA